METQTDRSAPVTFETHPDRYRHWKLATDGEIATLTMQVQEDGGMRPGYELKLNSYDLGVDIELQDAVQRLRFEHPEVRSVIVTGGLDRVFCAGANIHMLASSTHAFKVNFCKFTNETRLSIEDASRHSGHGALQGAHAEQGENQRTARPQSVGDNAADKNAEQAADQIRSTGKIAIGFLSEAEFPHREHRPECRLQSVAGQGDEYAHGEQQAGWRRHRPSQRAGQWYPSVQLARH